MNKQVIIIFLTIALVAAGITACSGLFGEEPTPEPVPVEAVQQPNVVSAEAFVVPMKDASLGFEVGGRVQSVNVEEGEEVDNGAILAELNNASQEAGVAQAQARVAEAQAQLANIQSGATPEEIAQAQATLDKAQAALAELVAGPTEEDIAQTEAQVEIARAGLAQVLAGSRDEDIQAAASRLLQAEAQVRKAQGDYDQFVYGEPDVLGPYALALEQATLDYERAQAEYDKLVRGATEEEVAVARAQLYEAQTALAKVKAGATAEQIAQAQAGVAEAQASLNKVKAGAKDEEIAVSEAAVNNALAALEAAQVELEKTQLTAPFAGTVGMVSVEEGEIVQPGTTLVTLGDTSQWQIETDDLTEIDVVDVQIGAPVQISVDALPEEEFSGQVARIQPQSETKAGDVTYTVLIDITDGPTARLRWGMTTFVDIQTDPDL
jgi:HlyD family secretion protein